MQAHFRVCLFWLLIAPFVAAQSESALSIEQSDAGYEIKIGKELFTEYHTMFEGTTKPILYPVNGPKGQNLLRNFPMRKGVAGEASDHPHHTGLFYTHGNVNGVNFWHVGGKENQGFIKQREVVKAAVVDGVALLHTQSDWVDQDDKLILQEHREQRFSVSPSGARSIEIKLTFFAIKGAVTFHDDKEGSMGIRTHPVLRVKGGQGQCINSEGISGKAIWGKPAKWVNYTAPLDGATVGIAIMDHPSNPRHPTTWHARDYGLIAANPFGHSYFLKTGKGSGDFTIPAGESATFTYRFLFHAGEDIAADYASWTKQP